VLKREQKEQWVAEIHGKLGGAEAVFVLDYRGLTVAEVNRLRKKLREVNGELRVVKNTLLRRASAGTGSAALEDLFTGPTALALAQTDPVMPAKVLTDFAKDVPRLELRAAVLKGRRLTVAEITLLAALPTLIQLRAKLLGTISAPAGRLVRLLVTPGGQLARAMALRRDQLPQPGAPPEVPSEARADTT
jgi:large subunit ribosomal protein L10